MHLNSKSNTSAYEYLNIEGTHDPGEDTLERFRYEFTYATILALELYRGEENYREIYCEHYEDIILVLENNKLTGIQVKTRELKYGPFTLLDEKITDAITRFVELEIKNPNRFENFVIVANCSFSNKKNGIEYLLSELQKNGYEANEEINNIIKKFLLKCQKKNSELTTNNLISVFKKLKCKTGPGLYDIHDVAIKYLRGINFNGNHDIHKLDNIVKRIINKIFFSASHKADDSIPSYCDFLDKKNNTNLEEVYKKRITKEIIDLVIKSEEEMLFLTLRNESPTELKRIGSSALMIQKMTIGGIDDMEKKRVELFSFDAESYIYQEANKYNNKKEFFKKIYQINAILLNIAAEAKTKSRLAHHNYGILMLNDIEMRIYDRVKDHHSDLFHFPYEILKGMIGILVSNCNIKFSDKEVSHIEN